MSSRSASGAAALGKGAAGHAADAMALLKTANLGAFELSLWRYWGDA